MSKIKTLITMIKPTPEIKSLLAELEPHADISFLPEGAYIGDYLTDVEVLYGSIPEKDFQRANKARWIQTNSTGVDHMMYPAFQNSSIILTNTGTSITNIVAEHGLTLLFALARNLHLQRDHMKAHRWEIECGVEIGGLTLGIIGFGKIGSAMALRAKAFVKEIHVLDAQLKQKPDYIAKIYTFEELPALLKKCNAVICSCPLTETTRHLIGDKEIALMPDKGYLINISRGGIVDEPALLRALRSKKLAGAGIDVLETEPCPPDSPLWNEPGLLLTPHSAGYCENLEKRKIVQFIANYKLYLNGELAKRGLDKKRGW